MGLQELRLIRTFDRIDMLKDAGSWSFRQVKKQRGVGGSTKTHWDYLMDEVVSSATLVFIFAMQSLRATPEMDAH